MSQPRIILGIDPGYDRCGWAVISAEGRSQITALEYGCIETNRKAEKYDRFGQIRRELEAMIVSQGVNEIALESLFFSRNVSTALPVSEVRGLIFGLALQHNLTVAEYQPTVIKSAVTGYGRADKNQVTEMVCRQLKLEKIPKIDDTGDALAVALTHAVQNPLVSAKL